jgi:hypothetical protein
MYVCTRTIPQDHATMAYVCTACSCQQHFLPFSNMHGHTPRNIDNCGNYLLARAPQKRLKISPGANPMTFEFTATTPAF